MIKAMGASLPKAGLIRWRGVGRELKSCPPAFFFFFHLKRVKSKFSGLGVRGPDSAPWKMPLGKVVPRYLGAKKPHGSSTCTEAIGTPKESRTRFLLHGISLLLQLGRERTSLLGDYDMNYNPQC